MTTAIQDNTRSHAGEIDPGDPADFAIPASLPAASPKAGEVTELFPVAETADQILDAPSEDERIIPIPALRLSIVARPFTMGEAEKLFEAATVADEHTGRPTVNLRVLNRLVFERAIIRPKFTQAQVNRLWEKNFKVIGPVIQELLELTGIDQMIGGEGAARRAFPMAGEETD